MTVTEISGTVQWRREGGGEGACAPGGTVQVRLLEERKYGILESSTVLSNYTPNLVFTVQTNAIVVAKNINRRSDWRGGNTDFCPFVSPLEQSAPASQNQRILGMDSTLINYRQTVFAEQYSLQQKV